MTASTDELNKCQFNMQCYKMQLYNRRLTENIYVSPRMLNMGKDPINLLSVPNAREPHMKFT